MISRLNLTGKKARPGVDDFHGAVTAKQRPDENSGGLFAACVAIAALYFAKDVLIPIALAVLMAFLLEPLAKRFERLRLGRLASALTAVFIAIAVIGGLAYCVLGQIEDLGAQWPKYETNIHEKLRNLGAKDGGVLNRAADTLRDFKKDLTPTNSVLGTNAPGNKAAPPEQKAVPVEVRTPEASLLQIASHIIGPSLNFVITVLLVTVFCVFILFGRDDLRARLIRVVGSRNTGLANKLLADTGGRISRYLFMQLLVNVCYGIPVGLGLWAIGIPNPLLWGMMATGLRYIPYAGPWIAAAFPFALGFAIDASVAKPLLVLGLFAVLEVITSNFVEPWLYGNSTGITPLAVLIAAVFWTWLWGPIGLLLSMPLTVCVVSISRYVPQMEMLDQLFSRTEK